MAARRRCRGLSLLELAVVIVVMVALVTSLFIGASAWKAGADRSNCVVNIRNVQLAARSFQNLYGKREGDAFQTAMIIGPSSFIGSMPNCPASGNYSFAPAFPPAGSLFMSCTVAGHAPDGSSSW